MEEYGPLFAKWTGSGQHFGFMNQPSAGYANYGVLVESVGGAGDCGSTWVGRAQRAVTKISGQRSRHLTEQSLSELVFRVKLGFDKEQDVADELWETLEP